MSFFEVITEAVNHFEREGFTSEADLLEWMDKIRAAAQEQMIPESQMMEQLRRHLTTIYDRVKRDMRNTIPKPKLAMPGEYSIEKVAPKLRQELDRRIMASANLIKLNRVQTIEQTLQRFAGWATSIPAGGSEAVDKKDTKNHIRKSLSDLPFRERRVIVDQGHKFNANLREIIAVDNGAIALIWHSHYRRPGYNYREDHKERDGNIYLLRDNWAQKAGLVKLAGGKYYDEITSCGEEVNCECYAEYLYYLNKLPDDMLTKKGREYVKLPIPK